MGTWVGVLAAPAPTNRSIDFDKLPSYYRTPGDKEEYERTRANIDQTARRSSRAVFISMALNPFHLGSASLRGDVRFCDASGNGTDLRYTTAYVSDAGAKLITYSDTSAEFGNLDIINQLPKLNVTYSGFSATISGTLKRGTLKDFEHLCSTLQTSH